MVTPRAAGTAAGVRGGAVPPLKVLAGAVGQGLPGPWAYGDFLVKGGRGVGLPGMFHTISFLLALPEFSPLFCPNLGEQFSPLPPASYAHACPLSGPNTF